MTRFSNLRRKKCIYRLLFVGFWALIIALFGTTGIYNYEHIPPNKILSELYKKTVPSLRKMKEDCSYDNILKSKKRTIESRSDIKRYYYNFSSYGIQNGNYVPMHCHPAFSVAIIVTYKNRPEQLNIFLPYIHNFLRKQNIHYKIYIIEQYDDKPFNKGGLYNIGVKQAIADQFPCLILHDVDLLPIKEGNLYACTQQPRHLSSSIDKFRYALPYDQIAGGVLAIRADQYLKINGFSNKFYMWGGEDDDFAIRLEAHNFTITRFSRRLSQYTMLVHKQEHRNPDRQLLYRKNHYAQSSSRDGYNTANYRSIKVKERRLFTHVVVKLLYITYNPLS